MAAGDLTLVSRGPPRRERVDGKVGSWIVRLILCAAVVFDLRFLPHIDSVVLLLVSWLSCRSCGLLELAAGLVSVPHQLFNLSILVPTVGFSYELLGCWYHVEL